MLAELGKDLGARWSIGMLQGSKTRLLRFNFVRSSKRPLKMERGGGSPLRLILDEEERRTISGPKRQSTSPTEFNGLIGKAMDRALRRAGLYLREG